MRMLEKNKDKRIKIFDILENEWLFPSNLLKNEFDDESKGSEQPTISYE